jgi:hypothetical protein
MKVVFKVNLGSIDAKSLGLDYTKCMVGKTCDVINSVADNLVARGIAELEDKAGTEDDIIQSAHQESQRRKDLQLKTVADESKLKGVK